MVAGDWWLGWMATRGLVTTAYCGRLEDRCRDPMNCAEPLGQGCVNIYKFLACWVTGYQARMPPVHSRAIQSSRLFVWLIVCLVVFMPCMGLCMGGCDLFLSGNSGSLGSGTRVPIIQYQNYYVAPEPNDGPVGPCMNPTIEYSSVTMLAGLATTLTKRWNIAGFLNTI